MDKKELLLKFRSVHEEVIASKDEETILVSTTMFVKTFEELVEVSPKDAQEIYECYEGTIRYNNFLTECEAEDVTKKFVNQDGSIGPKWRDTTDFFRKIEEMGGKCECAPYYNKWALYTTMCKYYSDQNSVILKWVGDDRTKYFEACYDLAVAQLKDKDHPCWVRWYFNVDDK